jgi:hypothetical protein
MRGRRAKQVIIEASLVQAVQEYDNLPEKTDEARLSFLRTIHAIRQRGRRARVERNNDPIEEADEGVEQ